MFDNDHASSVNEARHDTPRGTDVAQRTAAVPHVRTARSAAVPPESLCPHPEYPIERLCVHRRERFQLNFAREAQKLLGERDGLHLVASHQGLTIRAETEDAIDAALPALEGFYGRNIDAKPATVRYHEGATLEEPWMGLLVRCPAERLDTVKRDLIVRGATIMTFEILSSGAMIQASAPLSCLLGYAAALKRLTAGQGEHSMWLSHYFPVDESPPGGDAA